MESHRLREENFCNARMDCMRLEIITDARARGKFQLRLLDRAADCTH